MKSTFKYEPEMGLIRLTLLDEITIPLLAELAQQLPALIVSHHCWYLLTDARATTMNISTMEIYEWPGMMAKYLEAAGLSIHKLARALVVNNAISDFNFYETVSVNRNQNVKLFYDIDMAIQWLQNWGK
jgi:hypothetical protein